MNTEEAIDAIMRQAQVFASAWALVSIGADNGELVNSERHKADLRAMVENLANSQALAATKEAMELSK